MESLIVWGLLLIGAAFLLVVIELFVPTAGALGFTAAALAIAGVVVMFKADLAWGFSSLLAVAVLGPSCLAFGLRIWPNTPLGRKIIGAPSEDQVELLRAKEEEDRKRRLALIGAEGKVLIDLRPIGIVEVNGQRFDALSETRFVPAGARIRVTAVEGSELRVRQVS